MAKKKISDWISNEKDLAKYMVSYLESEGFDVYQEVPTINGFCDIMAKKDGLLYSFETKMSFSIEVMQQAELNLAVSNYSYVVIPRPKRFNGFHFKKKLLKLLNVGFFSIDEYHGVELGLEAPLQTKIKYPPKLKDWQKLNEAGGKERNTPFKQLCIDVKEYVKNREDGVSFRELWDNLDVHYTSINSFRSAFTNLIKRKEITNIEIKDKKIYDKKI